MRVSSILALLLSAFFNWVFFLAVANAQQHEITSNVFAFAAPDECLAFSAWGGQQAYDPNSSNATEKLMSEPEVKEFVEDMILRAGLVAPAMDAGDSKAKYELLHKLGPMLARKVLTKPGSFFVESVEVDDRGEPKSIKAAMLIDAGKDAAEISSLLSKMVRGEQALKQKTISGAEFAVVTVNEDPKIELFIGSSSNVLLVATDEKIVAETVARVKAKKVPGFLADFRSSDGIRNMRSLSYINIKSIREKFIVGQRTRLAFFLAGLGNVSGLETCNGLGEKQWINRMLIRLEGKPVGLLGLSRSEGLTAEDLKSFPQDSLFAAGVSLDAQRSLDLMPNFLNMMSGGRNNFYKVLREIERETGLDLREDVANNLGSSWTLSNGAADGWFAGLTLTTSIKDTEGLKETIETMMKSAMIKMRRDQNAPEFVYRKDGDHEINSIRFRGRFPLPVVPSWSIANDQLIIGLYPQAVESALKRTTTQALLQNEHDSFLRSSFEGNNSKLVGMAYVDAAANFEISYLYTQIMASGSLIDGLTRQMPAKQGRRLATLLSGIRLPRARVIHRHLEPSLIAVRQSDIGVEIEASQTIPSPGVGYVAPLCAAIVLPAVQATRGAARRTVSMNNMRQLGLSALNYESANMRFPPGYSVGEDGTKLLSWRVHVLPYLEHQDLYEQFNLDEPWDSPNNKVLIESMPEVFRSPVSSAKKGMTVYRGIGGDQGVLRGVLRGPNKRRGAVGFGSIPDGSSNTILLMETSDDLAVQWTKPDEGINPEQFDRAKVFGAYPDGTNMAMCDGSVHFLTKDTHTNKLKNLMRKHDGNLVSWKDNISPRNRRQQQMRALGPIDPRFVLGGSDKVLKLEDILDEAGLAKLDKEDLERKLKNNFRQIGLAILNFESAYQGFPSAYSVGPKAEAGDAKPKPLLSWRVHVLPFLEENQLYSRFNLDEPWDSEHNLALVEEMPDIYVVDPKTPAGKTTIVGIGGKQGIIGTQRKRSRPNRISMVGIGFGAISDGSSKTILIVDAGANNAVEWSKPTEFEPDYKFLKEMAGRDTVISMADSSVRLLKKGSVSPEELKKLVTRAGGEINERVGGR